MPKIKTHSGVKERFETSKNEKVIRGHAFESYISSKKSTKRKRILRQTTVTDVANVAKVKKMLPYK